MDSLADNYRFLARYNQWFNTRLADCCGQLAEEERKRDRGAFFGSIHRTFAHLLVADQIWLLRFRQCGQDHGWDATSLTPQVLDLPADAALNTVLFDDWAAVVAKRVQLDTAILQWTTDMPAAYPQWTMRYANTKGVRREHPAWPALTHFFNHQTHHRGQLTTLLMQAGVDPGTTDLIAML